MLYLEALKNYTIIYTLSTQYKILQNIGLLLKDKNFKNFIRIHRGFAVQKHFIQKISSHDVTLSNLVALPIGRNYKENLNPIL